MAWQAIAEVAAKASTSAEVAQTASAVNEIKSGVEVVNKSTYVRGDFNPNKRIDTKNKKGKAKLGDSFDPSKRIKFDQDTAERIDAVKDKLSSSEEMLEVAKDIDNVPKTNAKKMEDISANIVTEDIEKIDELVDSESINIEDSRAVEAESLDGKYNTPYKDRLDITPAEGERGYWTGTRGETKYIPDGDTDLGAKAVEKLSDYGMDGVDYKEAFPDFSKCSEESVKIDMTENRYGLDGNFSKADSACADKWNGLKKDGKSDWTDRDVANYRSENKLTWHECPDKETCQLISRDIHEYFGHSGGVAECKNAMAQNWGGIFDA